MGQEILTSVTLTAGHDLGTLPSVLCSLVPKMWSQSSGASGPLCVQKAAGQLVHYSCQKFLASPTSAQESSLEFVLTVYSLSMVVQGVPELCQMCAHLKPLPSPVTVKSLDTGHK